MCPTKHDPQPHHHLASRYSSLPTATAAATLGFGFLRQAAGATRREWIAPFSWRWSPHHPPRRDALSASRPAEWRAALAQPAVWETVLRFPQPPGTGRTMPAGGIADCGPRLQPAFFLLRELEGGGDCARLLCSSLWQNACHTECCRYCRQRQGVPVDTPTSLPPLGCFITSQPLSDQTGCRNLRQSVSGCRRPPPGSRDRSSCSALLGLTAPARPPAGARR